MNLNIKLKYLKNELKKQNQLYQPTQFWKKNIYKTREEKIRKKQENREILVNKQWNVHIMFNIEGNSLKANCLD